MNCGFGFRIAGPCSGERRLVDAAACLRAYAACNDKARVDSEAYLSAFNYPETFADYLRQNGTTKGYSGPCGAEWVWWDIDAAGELENATEGARALAGHVCEHYSLDDDLLLLFFSGAKGFHVGLPAALWTPELGPDFHRQARRFCEGIAAAAGVSIDSGVYDKVRAFRAPNSKHQKTGLHKRRLTFHELLHSSTAAILEAARYPEPFEVPEPATGGFNFGLAGDWQRAAEATQAEAEATARRRVECNGTPKLNRATLEFIRQGADVGDRHRLLFSASCNLAEFGCPTALAHALLTETALDSGLSPSEVRRQIDCGLKGGTP
ncbi:MAG: DNA primase [Candidatus Hydrogenedentes bacterium]|nr:DNA primase [Candidatus Hydrogenedentota bacterium]